MRRALLTSLIMLGAFAVLLYGTGQRGDRLTMGGKIYSIQTNPLERYFADHPESRPRPRIISTGLWRGYVAAWEIRGGRLVLSDVRIETSLEGTGWDSLTSVLGDIFPGQGSVMADWFNGCIIVPTGKLAKYVHMGYASEYKSYLVIWFERGTVTKEWRGGGRAFKRFRNDQFQLFKKTDTYRQAWTEERKKPENADMTDKELEEFLFEFYSEEIMSMMGASIR